MSLIRHYHNKEASNKDITERDTSIAAPPTDALQ